MGEKGAFDLSPAERAAEYRAFAEDMRSCAAVALNKETRLGYLKMAVDWLDMADRLEAEYGKVSVVVDPDLAELLRRDSS